MKRGSSHCWEDSRAQNEEETLLFIPSNDSAHEKPWTPFAIALPTSFPSYCHMETCTWHSMVADLELPFSAVLNKLIFAGEISGSLF